MSRKTTLPAGRYYIGDPCYVIDNAKWDEFLEPFWNEKPRGGIFDFDGFQCATFYTKHGDGVYQLEPSGDNLPVDAGCIGCIPLSLAVQGSELDGAYVTFDDPFECYEEDGNIHYGNYVVKTDDDDDDEYY